MTESTTCSACGCAIRNSHPEDHADTCTWAIDDLTTNMNFKPQRCDRCKHVHLDQCPHGSCRCARMHRQIIPAAWKRGSLT